MRQPAVTPTTGTVKTQPEKIHPIALQLIDLRSPLHSATPMVEPVMHMVVETGLREEWEGKSVRSMRRKREEEVRTVRTARRE